MWKCIRCEKENQDSTENCVNCGHGRTMDYTGHRVLSKICPEITDKWKQEQNDPENLKKQAIEYLRKAEELLRKSGLDRAVDKTREVITEVNQSSGQNKKPNIRIVENHHLTEQNTSAFRYGGENVLGGNESTKQEKSAFRYGGENVLGGDEPSKEEKKPNIRIVENHHLTEQKAKQNTSAFRYGGENVLGGNESPNIRIVENHHPTEQNAKQNTSAFRYGGENVLGGDTTI